MEFSTNYLPTWLTRLLAVDVPADATIESVESSFRGAMPWLLLVPVVLVIAGVIVLYLTERGTIGPIRRTLAIGLRVTLLALVLLLLAKPVVSLVLKRERPRGVAVLLDNSQSMTLVDRRLTDQDKLRVAIAKGLQGGADDPLTLKQASGGMARSDMVRAMLKPEFFAKLGKHGPVRPFLFGSDVRVPPDDDKGATEGETAAQKAGRQLLAGFRADESGTALAEAIVKVLHGKEGELPAAIVVVTDGQDNASKFTFSPQEVLQEAAQECARLGVPLYIYGAGTSEGGNLQLKEVLAPDTLFADDLVAVPVRCARRVSSAARWRSR